MAKGSKKGKSATKRERRERRFLPRSTTNPVLVQVAGGVGAAALGAGVWAQFGRALVAKASESAGPSPLAPYFLAGGAIVLGAAIWFGTSGDSAIHVGDAGLGLDKGSLRRLAWHQIESLTYDGSSASVIARGKDDGGAELVIAVPTKSQPEAAAWLLKEARTRIPGVIDIAEDAVKDLPEARTDDGEVLTLEAIQVVGKHCAASGTVIAYEPDARICPRCERVYHKANVPESCACGASLEALHAKTG
jgi:hypothetical protein